MNEYVLSTEAVLDIRSANGSAKVDNWQVVGNSGIARPALVLGPGDELEIGKPLRLENDSRLFLRYSAVHPCSGVATGLTIEFVTSEGDVRSLAQVNAQGGRTRLLIEYADISIGFETELQGSLRIRCVGKGEGGSPDALMAIFELVVGTSERFSYLRASAFRAERTANEIAHFASVYDHAMYGEAKYDGRVAAKCVKLANLMHSAGMNADPHRASGELNFPSPEQISPAINNAFDYAHRLLGMELRHNAPNFQLRLESLQKNKQGVVRVLSLCAGAARIEAQFSTALGGNAEWTLVDINEGLLQSATRNFNPDIPLRLIVADLNEIAYFGEQFDVIMCVSGLHHIVELERVVQFIRDALVDGGEFWSIGEAIGRSGNRLWPEDYRVANRHFRSIPARLRCNRVSKSVDENLPNVDYSEATFEGIRSDAIEPLLGRFLDPVDVYRRNCFLWRMVDLAYSDNYDMSSPEDIRWIQHSVAAELEHFRNGGRATEMHGVFRRREM